MRAVSMLLPTATMYGRYRAGLLPDHVDAERVPRAYWRPIPSIDVRLLRNDREATVRLLLFMLGVFAAVALRVQPTDVKVWYTVYSRHGRPRWLRRRKPSAVRAPSRNSPASSFSWCSRSPPPDRVGLLQADTTSRARGYPAMFKWRPSDDQPQKGCQNPTPILNSHTPLCP